MGRNEDTPCVRICRQDTEIGYCVGCGRTAREVVDWWTLSAEYKTALAPVLRQRLADAGIANGQSSGDKGRRR